VDVTFRENHELPDGMRRTKVPIHASPTLAGHAPYVAPGSWTMEGGR
jgi:hypothetical protein